MLNYMLYAGSLAFFLNWTGKCQVFSLLASVFYKTSPKRKSLMLPFYTKGAAPPRLSSLTPSICTS